MIVALLLAAVLVCAASAGTLGSAAANSGRSCHAPLLEGLTFRLARTIAGRAGCKIRAEGNPLIDASIQTVARQSPAAGAVTPTVTVWLNRACRKRGAYRAGNPRAQDHGRADEARYGLLSRRRPAAGLFLGPQMSAAPRTSAARRHPRSDRRERSGPRHTDVRRASFRRSPVARGFVHDPRHVPRRDVKRRSSDEERVGSDPRRPHGAAGPVLEHPLTGSEALPRRFRGHGRRISVSPDDGSSSPACGSTSPAPPACA